MWTMADAGASTRVALSGGWSAAAVAPRALVHPPPIPDAPAARFDDPDLWQLARGVAIGETLRLEAVPLDGEPRALDLHPALVGVAAAEHRRDAAAATVEAPVGGQGAIAIKCPSCGAPLEVAVGGGYVQCGYCGVQNQVMPRDENPLAGVHAAGPANEQERLARLAALPSSMAV